MIYANLSIYTHAGLLPAVAPASFTMCAPIMNKLLSIIGLHTVKLSALPHHYTT